MRRFRLGLFAAATLFAAAASGQDGKDLGTGLGPGPRWRGPVRPTARNEVFATGDGCAMCHSLAPKALAMRSPTGDDVSPHGLWRASVMANSFRDPYWRASVKMEALAEPERAAEIEAQCLRCHAPMHHHSRRLGGLDPVGVEAAAADPMAKDGVSCTVCHQIQPDGLGQETSWAGKPRIGRDRSIFGPYVEPLVEPMEFNANYTPKHGPHVQQSALCATCHTLHTDYQGERFPEQTPYLEWRNSVFSDEGGSNPESRTCQQCHMAELPPTRIARNPAGDDFVIPVRDPYRGHTFVGGNAFLLDMLAKHRDELGVTAPAAALQRNAQASRQLLAERTVDVQISELERRDGKLWFSVRVENKTGHKFPTGYPARRAWLHVLVRCGERSMFDSGGYTRDGRILDIGDPLTHEHHTLVTEPSQVVVWEMVAGDAEGQPTTHLTRMTQRLKDTRLLPKGWRRDGPHAAETAPIGIGNDFDFTAGGDTVHYSVDFPANAPFGSVVAWVRYQTIPPHWVEPMRALDAPECKSFVAMYDAADRTPETAGLAIRFEDR
jgi:hypothetical protein